MRAAKTRYGLAALAGAVALGLAAAPGVSAADVQAFGNIPCTDQEGVRFCQGSVDTRVKTFDGVPLDVNVTLPPAPETGADGPYPLLVQLHGWGGSKSGLSASKSWAADGYAVLNYTARGFGNSCGSRDSRLADPEGCAKGWVHLADSRYEARDTQHLAGLLADQGIAQPRIGVTGGSYGGGQSLELAALRDRVRMPDGSYVPWESSGGTAMEIAAAVPVVPWSDLTYSLVPNGRTLDYTVAADDHSREPVGVLKTTYVAGLFAAGAASGYYAPPLADPEADLVSWFGATNLGEPYGVTTGAAGLVPVLRDPAQELTDNHSAYGLEMDRAPAPTLISNGWTDDLFPVDEAVRWSNKVASLQPDATVAQLHFDYGHARGQSKAADSAVLAQRTREWMDRHLKGDAETAVLEGVEAMTQTCPRSAPSEGPFTAASWNELSPGEVRHASADVQVLGSFASDPRIGQPIDPIAGGGACATTPADDQPGSATYRLPPVEEGYTLLGSATVIADITVAGSAADSQVAARLWDVDPATGRQTLVARALYRPEQAGRQVFQLHPNGYRFAAGHVPKLELLGNDAPYGRPSNLPFAVVVSDLELRLPVHEAAGAVQVTAPADPVVPAGATLAP